MNVVAPDLTVQSFRERQAARPLLAYETLFAHDRWNDRTRSLADERMRSGWTFGTLPCVSLDPPIDWATLGTGNRSWRFHLHCWDALAPLLCAFHETRERSYLLFALRVALDWASQHTEVGRGGDFAWYDMAIGVRAYRLAYILDAAARDASIDDAAVEALLRCIELHAQACADERNFAAHSNHGLYLAAGQLAMARRLDAIEGMEAHHCQARKRIYQLLDTQFTSEGVHREHSPDYHRLVWETFDGVLRAGLIDHDRFADRAARIHDALAWFILPNNTLATFGDTPSRTINHPATGDIPDEPQMCLFRESGYGVVRSRTSYLAQTACFHSRVHKHADDLSMVWYDRGHEILVDPGRFGYLNPTTRWSKLGKKGFHYSHPSRVYVESTRAHNTVEIDGESHPRRGVKFYGSAIERTFASDSVFAIETHIRPRRTLRHARVLMFLPGHWLLVYDWLWDNLRRQHDYAQWFQFAPELELASRAGDVVATLPGQDARLYITALLDGRVDQPVRGIDQPRLQGWISRRDHELLPAWSVAQRSHGADTRLAMLLSFGTSPVERVKAKADVPGRVASFKWRQDGVRHALKLSRPLRGPMTLTYRHR